MTAVIVTNNGFVIGGEYLEHSPKGTTWKEHKYIKKDANGRYYYDTEAAESDYRKEKDELYDKIDRNRRNNTSHLSRSNSELAKGIAKARNEKMYDYRTTDIKLNSGAPLSDRYKEDYFVGGKQTVQALNLGLDFLDKMFKSTDKIKEYEKKRKMI